VNYQQPSWRADSVRDADEVVRWRPTIAVELGRTWAGPTDDGRWAVGEPGVYVLTTDSRAGAVALMPLLERPMADVKEELGGLAGVERMLEAAFETSPYWTARAIAWLEAGFPAGAYREALEQAAEDKYVAQGARHAAKRILAGW